MTVPSQNPLPNHRPSTQWIIGGVVVALIVAAAGVGTYYLTNDSASKNSAATSASAPLSTSIQAAATPPAMAAPSTTSVPSVTSAPPPPGNTLPVVASGAAQQLLLHVDDVGVIMKAEGLMAPTSQFTNKPLKDTSVPDFCVSAAEPGADEAYYNGYKGMAMQGIYDKPTKPNVQVWQAVVVVSDADAAQKIQQTEERHWPDCQNQVLAINQTNSVLKVQAGAYAKNGDILTLVAGSVTPGGVVCQRALKAYSNIVIDVRACSHSIANEGVDIVRRIQENVK